MLKKTGFISQELKKQILEQTDIVQLIGEYVQLKPAGKNFVGLCPFHQEKTPSFTVSPSYQNFKCYGCGESGDSVGFVMKLENLPFMEALQLLADRSGIQLQFTRKKNGFVKPESEIDKCLELSFHYFRDNLLKAGEESIIKNYLKSRRINRSLADSFELGYAEDSFQNLNVFLKGKSVSDTVQERAGLIKKSEKGGYYVRLRDRLIFPIRNGRGQLLGFAGRIIRDKKEAKYMNPPETERYKKSTVFYGLDKASDIIRRKRRAILVEGYLDVIRLHEHSWIETIATCGTAVTRDHISELKKNGAEEAILLFDGDDAGIKAAEKSARFFIENDLDSKVIILPEGLDPDDYFKTYTNQEFEKLLENALYDFEFIILKAREQFPQKGIRQRENLIKEVVDLTKNMGTGAKKDLFLAKAAEEFKVGIKKLREMITQSDRQEIPQPPNQGKSATKTFAKEHLPEVRFLQFLMNHVQEISTARQNVSVNDFINKELSEIYARFLQLTDDEFKLLSARDFPEQFVEYHSLLMYLLHHESEYQGPAQIRPGSEERLSLNSEEMKRIWDFSRDAMNRHILNLKKNRKAHDLKKLRYFSPDQEKDMVRQFIENRRPDPGMNKASEK